MRVSIYQSQWSGFLAIMFWYEKDGKVYAAKPCELVFEEAEDYSGGTKPTIRIPHVLKNEFMKALAEELDKNGIKTDSDAKMKGTLEATRYHLEDLRKILKLKGAAR